MRQREKRAQVRRELKALDGPAKKSGTSRQKESVRRAIAAVHKACK
jgi:hypothetical protein